VRVALADLTDVGELSVQTQQGPAFGGSDIEIDLTATSRDDLESATADLLEAVRDLDVTAEATSNLADTSPTAHREAETAKAHRG